MDALTWPPQSLDLDPMEHVWAHVKRKLNEHPTLDKRMLRSRKCVQAPFHSITPKCRKFYHSMGNCIQGVLVFKRGWTHHWSIDICRLQNSINVHSSLQIIISPCIRFLINMRLENWCTGPTTTNLHKWQFVCSFFNFPSIVCENRYSESLTQLWELLDIECILKFGQTFWSLLFPPLKLWKKIKDLK